MEGAERMNKPEDSEVNWIQMLSVHGVSITWLLPDLALQCCRLWIRGIDGGVGYLLSFHVIGLASFSEWDWKEGGQQEVGEARFLLPSCVSTEQYLWPGLDPPSSPSIPGMTCFGLMKGLQHLPHVVSLSLWDFSDLSCDSILDWVLSALCICHNF